MLLLIYVIYVLRSVRLMFTKLFENRPFFNGNPNDNGAFKALFLCFIFKSPIWEQKQ